MSAPEEIDQKIEETAFHSLNRNDPSVKLLNRLLSEAYISERDLAMSPNITQEARTYNCGRAAAVLDIIELLKSNRWPFNYSVDFE